MVYFKLEFGFGRGKRAENSSENGRKSDDFHLPGEQAMPEKRGRDFVAAEVERARQEQRYKIAQNYLTAARSWTTFLGDEDWRFSDMNAERLEEYQRWLVGRNLCMNTISAYMRALRAMYRRVSDGEDGNPFAKVFTGRAKTAKLYISLIGKALGHTKSSTTFIYIKSLFDAGLAEVNQKLMSELGL